MSLYFSRLAKRTGTTAYGVGNSKTNSASTGTRPNLTQGAPDYTGHDIADIEVHKEVNAPEVTSPHSQPLSQTSNAAGLQHFEVASPLINTNPVEKDNLHGEDGVAESTATGRRAIKSTTITASDIAKTDNVESSILPQDTGKSVTQSRHHEPDSKIQEPVINDVELDGHDIHVERVTIGESKKEGGRDSTPHSAGNADVDIVGKDETLPGIKSISIEMPRESRIEEAVYNEVRAHEKQEKPAGRSNPVTGRPSAGEGDANIEPSVVIVETMSSGVTSKEHLQAHLHAHAPSTRITEKTKPSNARPGANNDISIKIGKIDLDVHQAPIQPMQASTSKRSAGESQRSQHTTNLSRYYLRGL